MDIELFDYDLPEELIAQTPLANRTESRLLTLDKKTGAIGHHSFQQWIDFLRPGDTVVLNDTKVMPARLFGFKQDTGAKIEVLLLQTLGDNRWEALIRPAKRARPGTLIEFGKKEHAIAPLAAEVLEAKGMGRTVLKFSYQGVFQEILDQLGEMPLPPYIKERLNDKNRYQTVYAKVEGSAAAPTAGLHLSKDYISRMRNKGISIAYVTLHVGLGTFRPVTVTNIKEHEMHAEFFSLSEETAQLLNVTKKRNGRIIAVGTTSMRVLETAAGRDGEALRPAEGWTDIFIYPGYRFNLVDGLLTNFHLPKSTLMMLISALAGRKQVLQAYQEAVQERYRFFSFGDAMFIADFEQ